MILQQIRSDIAYLKNLILMLTSDSTNGISLSEDELERALEQDREAHNSELERLEIILESCVIPDIYYSNITKQIYSPSLQELELKSRPLPSAKHAFFCKKTSRKAIHRDNSYLTVLNDRTNQVVSFYIEHEDSKNYPRGGFATKIKKGFLTSDCITSKYAVKIYRKDQFSDIAEELRVAMRAAYCYQQLGREGYAFRRNNKQYLVTDWLPGENLGLANQQKIQSMSVPDRIIMAISLLTELNILHKLGLIHGDIKPENVMVSSGKLNLVDMDSVRSKNGKSSHDDYSMFTPRYLPSAQMSYDSIHNYDYFLSQFDENTDLYAMGLTLIHLFQDIYIPQEKSEVISIKRGAVRKHTFETFSISHGPQYEKHPELQKLLKNMVFQDPTNLKTTEEYINEMKKIVAKYPGYEQYYSKPQPRDLVPNLSVEEGMKAFKEIEIELHGYNHRLDVMNKQDALNELVPPRNKPSWSSFGLFAAVVAVTTAAVVIGGELDRVAAAK